MDRDKKRQFIIIGIAIGVLLIIGLLVWMVTAYRNNQNTPDTLSINNYDLVKNISDSRKINITGSLYIMVDFNTDDSIDISKISDATIRGGSEKQTDDGSGQYSGNFIVDIPSLKQSYMVSYLDSKVKNGYDSGYPVIVSCLKDVAEIIYKDFDCKEISTYKKPSDPLFEEKLPYSGPYFNISGTENDGEKTIIVKIMINTNTIKLMETFKLRKSQANKWLESQGFKLSDYTIEYRNLSNQLIPEEPDVKPGDHVHDDA